MAQKRTANKITDLSVKPGYSTGFLGRLDKYYTKKGYKDAKRVQDYTPHATQPAHKLYEVLQQYKFSEVEFGNWATQNERHVFTRSFIQSAHDIAQALGFKQLGMEHTIGIAYGARGKSKAFAHFEPHTFMINLTKQKGFGSFAHEYGHALDYFFGTFIEQSSLSRALSMGQSTAQTYTADRPGTLRFMTNDLINKIIVNGPSNSASYQQWQQYATSDYWLRRNEIFARFFEQYIHHLLAQKGIQNTLLTKQKYEGVFYLMNQDFNRVLPLANKLIAAMKKRVNA